MGPLCNTPSLKPFGGSTLSIRHFQMHFCHSQVGTQASIYPADVSRAGSIQGPSMPDIYTRKVAFTMTSVRAPILIFAWVFRSRIWVS